MLRTLGLFLAVNMVFLPTLRAQEDTFVTHSCGEERYDDFMRARHHEEQRMEELQKAASEIKAAREAHEKQIREASKDIRRAKADSSPQMEAEWNEQVKAYKETQEINRKRYVLKRDELAKNRCYSKKIPEDLEYDLQDQ